MIQYLKHQLNKSRTEEAVKKFKSFGKILIYKLQKFQRNFKSEIYTLRLLQLAAIFLVQRYFTYYSLGLMAWVLLTGFTINHRFTMITSFLFAIPSLITIYIFLVFYNIKDNPFIPSWASQQLGFDYCTAPWLEIIILNVGLFLFFFYNKQVLQSFKDKQKERFLKKTGVKFGVNRRAKSTIGRKKKQKSKEVGYFVIFQAFLLKYSYLLALFMIYWISFYAVNLVHVVLVGLFLVFFSNMNTTIEIPRSQKKNKTSSQKRSQSGEQVQPTPTAAAGGIRGYDFTPHAEGEMRQNLFHALSDDPSSANLQSKGNEEQDGTEMYASKVGAGAQHTSRSKKTKQVTFGRRYWIIMVIYVELYLIARYLYFLIWKDNIATNSYSFYLLDFIGISYPYSFPIHVGLTHDDVADESIIWILFYFIILQYDSYKSKIYMKYSHKITEIFAKKPLIKKVFPNFISYISSQNISYPFYPYSLIVNFNYFVLNNPYFFQRLIKYQTNFNNQNIVSILYFILFQFGCLSSLYLVFLFLQISHF